MHRDFAVAVKAVIVRGDEVLVLRRSIGEMPGGGLHFYEKAEDGLLREIREETSLSVEIGRPVSMFDIIRHQIHLCIFTYAAVWTGGEVQLSKEHDGFLWLHKDEVEESELPHWMKRDIFRALEAVENH